MHTSLSAAEVAERSFRLKLAGITEADVEGVATKEIRIPVHAAELAVGLTDLYMALKEPELEPLVALDVMQGHRVKEKLMHACIACSRRGDEGVLQAMRLIMEIIHDLHQMPVLDAA